MKNPFIQLIAERGCVGNRDVQPPARPQHARNFTEHGVQLFHVLQGVVANYGVEAGIGKGEVRGIRQQEFATRPVRWALAIQSDGERPAGIETPSPASEIQNSPVR